jgi:pyruvate formate lyase activating enzyme
MKKALFYRQEADGIRCFLCPHNCFLKEGKYGICNMRKNEAGVLYSMNYGIASSIAVDPIEKKPLYHFYPGTKILSIGSIGCNLRCRYCQNYTIAQGKFEDFSGVPGDISPEDILSEAESLIDSGSIGVAYTYNEPIIWYEFMLDIAKKIKAAGMKNVMVSNGYINPEPLDGLLEVIDAFSIDLKGFTEGFYKEITGSSLEPVKRTLERIATSGKHLEVEYLVIPGYNDDKKEFLEMLSWYEKALGRDVPLHINRYFPMYKMKEPATPMKILEELYKLACERLDYVYIGNVDSDLGRDTLCPHCRNLIIERSGYYSEVSGAKEGLCKKCGNKVRGEGL